MKNIRNPFFQLFLRNKQPIAYGNKPRPPPAEPGRGYTNFLTASSTAL